LTTPLGHEGTSILLVEDDEPLRDRLARAFAHRGLEVRAAATVDEALAMAREDPPELVLLDLRVGDANGLQLIPLLKEIDPGTRLVVLTGYGSVATAVEAVRRGATNYLTKPADADEILAAFRGGAAAATGHTNWQAMSLGRVEWEHINRVLMECDGNISEAARVLGLHRRSLQRKLTRYPPGR
jgi:two-component system response regulator RegA